MRFGNFRWCVTPTRDLTLLIAQAKEGPLGEILDALEGEGITVAKAVPGAVALFTLEDALGRKPDSDLPEDDLALLADLGAGEPQRRVDIER